MDYVVFWYCVSVFSAMLGSQWSTLCVSRRFSCRGAEADSHGLAVEQTMVIPRLQFLNEVIDVPGMQVVQVLPLCATTGALHSCSSSTRSLSSLSWRRGISPLSCCSADHRDSIVAVHGGLCPCLQVVHFPLSWCRGRSPWSCCLQTIVSPRCAWTRWSMPLLCRSCCFPSRSHPCRGAETVSHGLADHGDSAVARGQGVRRPCLQVVSVPQVLSHRCPCLETRFLVLFIAVKS